MRMTLFIHILAGGLGLVLGAVALYAAKGARLHRKSGMLFVCAMFTMALTGAVIAAITGVEASVIAGLLTAYLVITALTTVRPTGSRWLYLGVTVVGLAVGLTGVTIWFVMLISGESTRDEIPAAVFLVFGATALLASVSDLRLIRSGGIRGARRIARHLWRMCFALFIASASFFLGQADKIPEPLRIIPLLIILALAPLAVLLYWLWRVRIRKTFRGIVSARSPEAL